MIIHDNYYPENINHVTLMVGIIDISNTGHAKQIDGELMLAA